MSTNPSHLPSTGGYAEQRRLQLAPRTADGADERHLMERVCERDEQSLIAIYDRYSRLAYGIAFHVLRDPSSAEDIVQEIFLRLWRQPAAYDSKRGSLSAWIAMNTRHRAVDYWRKHRREAQMSEDLLLVEAVGTGPEEPGELARVQTILGGLSASQREILELSYFRGLSHSEIVARTGLPLGTVKSRSRQAIQKIRRLMLIDPSAGKH